MGLGISETVVSGGAPCGKKKNTTTNKSAVIAASKINTYCHPKLLTTKLPAEGASKGERPITNTSSDMIDALFSGGKKSCTIAMAATEETQPPRACANRIISRLLIVLQV